MGNKGKKIIVVLMVIFMITTILGASTTVYFYLKTSSNLNELKLKDESIVQLESEVENLKKDVNVVLNEEVDELKFLKFDQSKSKEERTWENRTYTIISPDGTFGFSVLDGKVSVDLKVSVDTLVSRGIVDEKDVSNIKINNNKICEVSGLSGRVSEVKALGTGHSYSSQYIIFLMEDGTCEYAKSSDFVLNLESQGKIEGLSNIARIEQAIISTPGPGWASPIAIDKDGYFYDIGEMLK